MGTATATKPAAKKATGPPTLKQLQIKERTLIRRLVKETRTAFDTSVELETVWAQIAAAAEREAGRGEGSPANTVANPGNGPG
jgi:hypothetical protein